MHSLVDSCMCFDLEFNPQTLPTRMVTYTNQLSYLAGVRPCFLIRAQLSMGALLGRYLLSLGQQWFYKPDNFETASLKIMKNVKIEQSMD